MPGIGKAEQLAFELRKLWRLFRQQDAASLDSGRLLSCPRHLVERYLDRDDIEPGLLS